MTLRDRLVLMSLLVLAVVGGAWVLIVSPERKKAAELGTQLATAKAQLSSAEGELANARREQSRYADAYGQIVSLGKAVPTSQEVPSLIYELAKVSQQKSVDFASIAVASSGGAASSSATASATASSFTALPFTFTFNGSYAGLEHMLRELQSLATRSASGKVYVRGRLLTVSGLKLTPVTEAGKSGQRLTAAITASAYMMPPESVSSSSSSASAAGSAPASTSAAASTTAPAIVGVKP